MKKQPLGLGSRLLTIWSVVFILLIFSPGIAFSKNQKFKPGFSIKLGQGKSYYFLGNINRCLESFNNSDLFNYVREEIPERLIGEIIKLDYFVFNWEAEVSMDIGRGFAISLATSETIIKKNESSLTYTYKGSVGDQISAFTFRPEVKVFMPLQLGICYTLPFISKINIIFDTGIGYYSAKVSQYKRLEVTPPSGDSEWVSRYWETDFKGVIGFHSGISLELSLTKNLAFVIEAEGRYAKIKNLKGIMTGENKEGIYSIRKGTLYYYNMWDVGVGTRYDNLIIWETPPFYSIWDIADVRKAVLDLSGFSLSAGIRIGLF